MQSKLSFIRGRTKKNYAEDSIAVPDCEKYRNTQERYWPLRHIEHRRKCLVTCVATLPSTHGV